MTLQKIYDNGAKYALNEITGELVTFVEGRPVEQKTVLIPSDVGSTLSLCRLLFDDGAIAENWSPISNCEARMRHERHVAPVLLGGCIACQRVY